MKLFGISSANFTGVLRSFKSAERDDLIFWGVIGMVVLFFFFTAWAGYMFVTTSLGERNGVIGMVRPISLNEDDIKKAIELLDERERKFKEVLSGQ